MFAKLLKHEFNANKGVLFVLSLAALGVGLLGGLIMLFLLSGAQSNMSELAEIVTMVFSTFALIGTVLALCAYAVAVLIMLLLRFYRHHFTNEGYLTFTLPATTNQILFASLTNIVIWMLICGIVLLLSFGMIMAPVFVNAVWEGELDLRYFFQDLRFVFDQMDLAIFPYILSVISAFIYSLTLPLLCITIGSIAAKKHKLLASFGIYYGINMALSTLTGILTIIVTFTDSIADFQNAYTLSFIVPALLQLAIGIGSYFLMHHLISKKLNLQ